MSPPGGFFISKTGVLTWVLTGLLISPLRMHEIEGGRSVAATVVLSMVYIILTLLATIGNTAIFIAYYKWRVSFSSYKVTLIHTRSHVTQQLLNHPNAKR